MTKKDFKIIAEILSAMPIGISHIEFAIAKLKIAYPNFDSLKFISYLTKQPPQIKDREEDSGSPYPAFSSSNTTRSDALAALLQYSIGNYAREKAQWAILHLAPYLELELILAGKAPHGLTQLDTNDFDNLVLYFIDVAHTKGVIEYYDQ